MPPDEFYLEDYWNNRDDFYKKRKIRLKDIHDTRALLRMYQTNTGTLRFAPGYCQPTLFRQSEVGTGSNSIAMTAGVSPTAARFTQGTYEVLDVTADLTADGTVADRALTLSIYKTNDSTPTTTKIWTSQAVTTSATEVGFIWLPCNQSGNYYVDDDGTSAKSTNADNPLPLFMSGTDAIGLAYTSAKAGDISTLRIIARKVNWGPSE
ncbi:MAG: hypothetical protein ACYTEQ_24855 [Planctomycetota bacterium]|jgi:hypothetical protein